jgi:hypothetical protein
LLLPSVEPLPCPHWLLLLKFKSERWFLSIWCFKLQFSDSRS